jgi:predicted P-loop ATPase
MGRGRAARRWMTRLLGAPDTPFVRTHRPKVLISAVARAIKPGCKVDTVLVLEGEQGIKKSSAIAALFGEEYTAESVSLFDQHNKMVMSMMGAWVVELAEFVAIARSHHASVKGLISMRQDKVVLPYAKMASTHPRRCIFFGTINPTRAAISPIPPATGAIGRSPSRRSTWRASPRFRDQLWAEAVHRYRDGERWWLEPEEEAAAAQVEQADREEEDAWVEPLEQKIEAITELTTDKASPSMTRCAPPPPDDALHLEHLLGIPHERKDKKASTDARRW